VTCPDCGHGLESFRQAVSGIVRHWCNACQALFEGGDTFGLRRSISVNTRSIQKTASRSAVCLARTTAFATTSAASSAECDSEARSGSSL
jgi:hypothetical protein